MATAGKLAESLRWERALHGPGSLAEDLGSIGEYVGPRTGPDKRTHGEKEDYALRRLLAAMTRAGRLAFPVTVRAEAERDGEPDFVLTLATGETFGVEATEAGDESHQAWLTRLEREPSATGVALIPGGGIADRDEIPHVADQLAEAIRKKVQQFDEGKYRTPEACELAVYDNTAWGGYLDKGEIVDSLRRQNDLSGRFRAVHLVFESHVVLDALGPGTQVVDISKLHEIDLSAWLFDQADRLKRSAWIGIDGIDAEHIAEELETLGRKERRALESHLLIRLLHMIKWAYQPERRSRSWFASLGNALREMEDVIATSPSLRREGFLDDLIAATYSKARSQSLLETRLPAEAVPEPCQFTIEQIFDPEFPGLEPEED